MALASRVALPRRAARIIAPYNALEYQSWFPWLRTGLIGFMVVSVVFATLLTSLAGTVLLKFAVVPVVMLGAAVMWLLPDADRHAVATAEPQYFKGTLLLYLLSLVIWPNYLAIVIPGLPWITPPRLVLAVMLVLMVVHYPQHSKARGTLAEVLGYDRIALLLFGLYEVMNVLVLPMAPSLSETVSYYLLQQLQSLAVVLMAGVLMASEANIALIVRTVVLGSIFTMSVGVLENYMQSPPWANYIPPFMRIDENFLATFLSPQARAGDSRYRIRTTFPIVLYYTQYLSLMVPLILYTCWQARKRHLAVAIALLGLLLHTIWFTNARTAFISLLVPLFAFAGMGMLRLLRGGHKRDTLKLGLVLSVLLLAMALLGGALATSHRLQMYTFGGSQHASSDETRDEQWNNAWNQLRKNPIGIGAGNSVNAVGVERPGKITLIVDSLYINMLVDVGFIGFVGFFGLFLRAAWIGVFVFLRAARPVEEYAGAAAIGLISFVIVCYVISTTDNVYLALLFAGIILAIKRLQDQRLADEARAAAAKAPANSLVRRRA